MKQSKIERLKTLHSKVVHESVNETSDAEYVEENEALKDFSNGLLGLICWRCFPDTSELDQQKAYFKKLQSVSFSERQKLIKR